MTRLRACPNVIEVPRIGYTSPPWRLPREREEASPPVPLVKRSARKHRGPRPETILSELTCAANAGRPPGELLARGLDLLLGVTGLSVGVACSYSKADERPAVLATHGLRA